MALTLLLFFYLGRSGTSSVRLEHSSEVVQILKNQGVFIPTQPLKWLTLKDQDSIKPDQ